MNTPKYLPPSADKTAASPGEGATTRCVCTHPDVFHDFAKNNRTRTSCSVSTGPKATRCTCKSFTPDIPEGLPND